MVLQKVTIYNFTQHPVGAHIMRPMSDKGNANVEYVCPAAGA